MVKRVPQPTLGGSGFRQPRSDVVVVHLFGALDPGGAEVRTLELLRRRQGNERHTFVALSGRSGSLDQQFRDLGHTVVHRGLSPWFPVWLVWYLRRSHATHVHSHVHLASGYLLALAVIARVPRRIAHFRTTSDGREESWLRRIYRKVGWCLVRLSATDVVMVSNAVADCLWSRHSIPWRRTRARVIYNQVDGKRFVPRLCAREVVEAPRLISIGRLDRGKNPQRAVEVLAALRKRRPGASLTLVGHYSPAQYDAVMRVVKSFRVEEAVDILGERNDVADLLVRSDLLLATTVLEGLPGSIVESAAAGIPAVVSAIPASEEVATFLPSVITVPLDASSEVWCDVIEDVLSARAKRLAPVAVRTWFDNSPFALALSELEFDALWS